MSRSRSLSYCSLSYSWRLIRFTRRRRRSGTAWGLEKAHTHTCMYMHTRTDQTCPSRQWERHTDAYMHAQTQLDTTQNRSELLFKYKYNWVSAHLNEWQLDQRRKLRKNKQLSWTPALHYWRCFGPSDFQWKWSHAEMLPTYLTKAGQTKTLELNKYFSSKQHSGVQLNCFYLIFNSSSVFFRSCENRSMSSDI